MRAVWLVVSLLAGLLIAGAVSAEPARRPEVGEYVQAYSGGNGVKVWMTRIGPRTDNRAIVQISGIDHEWDKKIQLMNVQDVLGEKRYSLSVNGNSVVVLNIDSKGHGYLHLPGESSPRSISYSEALSQMGDSQRFLTDYLQQGDK